MWGRANAEEATAEHLPWACARSHHGMRKMQKVSDVAGTGTRSESDEGLQTRWPGSETSKFLRKYSSRAERTRR